MAHADGAQQTSADRGLVIAAVAVAAVSTLALAIVVVLGVTGAGSAPALAWVGMIGLPVAFALMVVVLLRAAVARRRA